MLLLVMYFMINTLLLLFQLFDFEQLYISFGCNKREEIIRIKRGIIKQRDKLENIKSWIVNSSRDFSSSCEEGASRIARLPNVKFGKRR